MGSFPLPGVTYPPESASTRESISDVKLFLILSAYDLASLSFACKVASVVNSAAVFWPVMICSIQFCASWFSCPACSMVRSL